MQVRCRCTKNNTDLKRTSSLESGYADQVLWSLVSRLWVIKYRRPMPRFKERRLTSSNSQGKTDVFSNYYARESELLIGEHLVFRFLHIQARWSQHHTQNQPPLE